MGDKLREHGFDPASTSPRVDELIAGVMRRFPGISRPAQARYYEEVHQHLAPLARALEAEVVQLRAAQHSSRAVIAENEYLRRELILERTRFERAIKILSNIHAFLLPNDVPMLNGGVFEFNNPEIEHEMLRRLSNAIRAVPDEVAAIDAASKGGKS